MPPARGSAGDDRCPRQLRTAARRRAEQLFLLCQDVPAALVLLVAETGLDIETVKELSAEHDAEYERQPCLPAPATVSCLPQFDRRGGQQSVYDQWPDRGSRLVRAVAKCELAPVPIRGVRRSERDQSCAGALHPQRAIPAGGCLHPASPSARRRPRGTSTVAETCSSRRVRECVDGVRDVPGGTIFW